MTISTAPFPLCCSARVIHNFGGGHVGEIEDYSKKEAIAAIKAIIKTYKPQYAVLVAMPTSTQPNAYAALEELGFYHHPDGIDGGGNYARLKHKMSCMFLPLNEWDEKAFNERYDPKKDEYIDGPNHGVKAKTGGGHDPFDDDDDD